MRTGHASPTMNPGSKYGAGKEIRTVFRLFKGEATSHRKNAQRTSRRSSRGGNPNTLDTVGGVS